MNTKKGSILILLIFIQISFASAENNEKYAPVGFDNIRKGIVNGKLDTISYSSKTVGVARRALVYTPPGFSKSKEFSLR